MNSAIMLLLPCVFFAGCSITHTVSRQGISTWGSLPRDGKIILASGEELEASRLICGRDITTFTDSAGHRRNIPTGDLREIKETDRFLGGFLGFLAGGAAGGGIGYWSNPAHDEDDYWSGLGTVVSTAFGVFVGVAAGTVTGACIGYRTNHEFVRDSTWMGAIGVAPVAPARADSVKR